MLCRIYWYPLYAYLRRSGCDVATAEDYVQGFFTDVLSRGSLQLADPTRGKFRTFLITACKNSVSNQRRNARAIRRGGGQKILSIDLLLGENCYVAEPIDQRDPINNANELVDAELNDLLDALGD